MLSQLDLDPQSQGHGRNQKIMIWGTKTCHPKNFEAGGGALVIGVTLTRTPAPTRTPTLTAVKQYVDPHPNGGEGVDINIL